MSSFNEDDAFEAAVQPQRPSLSQLAMQGAREAAFGARKGTVYLDDLNPAQREAVEALEGPVLILAGAGTGKTKTLMARVAHLITTDSARANEILAVTFTNKAAKEMQDRLRKTPFDIEEPVRWMGTFHSISAKLLRRHAELVGLKSNFTILDTDDSIRLLKQLISAAGIDEKRWPARQLSGMIDNWKNRALTPSAVSGGEGSEFNGMGVKLYAQYQERLMTLNAVDFGDLLLHMVVIFQKHPDLLEQYQRWFKYILVDEYQDTNVAQYLWLRLLAGGHKNICCVGDDDQSIYGWRGAEVGNILRFEKDFPGAKVVRLEQNYRSTEHILKAAGTVIANNKDRLGKELKAVAKEEGHKVKLTGYWDGEEEAREIGEKIESHQEGRSYEARNRYNPRLTSFQQELDRRAKAGLGPIDEQAYIKQAFDSRRVYTDLKTNNLVRHLLKGDKNSENMLGAVSAFAVSKYSLDEIAILVRASHQMRAFEDRFLSIGLPYRVIGGPRFYERMEIRDAMAYFRIVTQPEDDLAFERIINTPKRGVGDKALQEIQICARRHGVPLLEAAGIAVEEGLLKGKAKSGVAQLVEQIRFWRHLETNIGNAEEIARYHLKMSEQKELLIQTEELYLEKSSELERTKALELLDEDQVVDGLDKLEAEVSRLEDEVVQIQSRLKVLEEIVEILEGNFVKLAEKILDESGYTAMWQNDKTPEAPGRLENLKELVKALEQFDNLAGFLEHVALIMDNDSGEDGEKVTIMTLHGAKGLEFPVVFLPGWEEGLFPSQRSMDENGTKGLEEERRLAYVGITRAEELCTISFAANRRVYGQWQSQLASRFIDELPVEHVDILTPNGLYGAQGNMGGRDRALDDYAQSSASRFNERASKADVYNSPGWKRMQERTQRAGTPRAPVTLDLKASSSFTLGDRVFHKKFGYGEVMEIEGENLTVEFDHSGTKKLKAGFVMPADQAGDVPF